MTTDVMGLATARKTSRSDLLNTWLSGGHLRIYSGTRPASADDAITDQTLLAEFDIPDPAGSVSNGVFTADDIDPELVLADGTAAWARAVDSSNVTIGDFDIGTQGSGAAIIIDNATLVTGGMVSILSWSMTEL